MLAGGAILGALQVGMVQALCERGVKPDLFVGTSAGALNAAYLAARPDSVQTVQELAGVWHSIHRQDVFPIHPPTLIGGLATHRDHLVPDRSFKRLITRHLGLERLEQARVPVHPVCFDLLSGQEVRLSEVPRSRRCAPPPQSPGSYPPCPGAGICLSTAGW